MEIFNILLAENDPRAADSLASSLDPYAHSVTVVRSLPELRAEIVLAQADLVVADLETISLPAAANLFREFHLPIICTHRVPDDELWTAALEAGAEDVCDKANAGALLHALRNSLGAARFAAA